MVELLMKAPPTTPQGSPKQPSAKPGIWIRDFCPMAKRAVVQILGEEWPFFQLSFFPHNHTRLILVAHNKPATTEINICLSQTFLNKNPGAQWSCQCLGAWAVNFDLKDLYLIRFPVHQSHYRFLAMVESCTCSQYYITDYPHPQGYSPESQGPQLHSSGPKGVPLFACT